MRAKVRIYTYGIYIYIYGTYIYMCIYLVHHYTPPIDAPLTIDTKVGRPPRCKMPSPSPNMLRVPPHFTRFNILRPSAPCVIVETKKIIHVYLMVFLWLLQKLFLPFVSCIITYSSFVTSFRAVEILNYHN